MARQKKNLEKSIDVVDVKDVEEIVEQTEDVKDVEEDEVEDVDLTQRQLLCKWELNRLITIYGIDDFEKVVKMMLE